ncbi:23S rRNA (adenine(2503)-C(2))-methyltransferase RlmN [Brachyspira pilosicoli]|uniref:23S rRNA (adenine(2503)-C(2))-methyltransferase RlmN n=1 Tax=Brachyspira pilosicoli TaxID=52584 RepID=UPI003006E825
MPKKISIMNVSEEDLSKFCIENNFPKFHASQILNWIYKKYAISFDEMSNIPKDLRALLDENYFIHNSKIESITEDEYGTRKLLISLYDKKKIESVILGKNDRVTFCLSSQVGCGYGCAFCATGSMGLSRNLTADEILAEFILMRAVTKKVNSIVFMGMGEPLANTKNLFKAIDTINSYKGFNLGIRHITISTSGEVAGIKQLIDRDLDCRLAVSLHSLKNEVRDKIMPINKRYPIENLINILKRYSKNGKRMITFEWVLIKDVNDSVNDAYRLVNLKKEFPFKVNIIPMNPVEHAPELQRPNKDIILRFKSILKDNGIEVVERFKQGQEILAGCGQLAIKNQ